MSYKINVASYLTKATVGSGLKIFIFFFFGGEESRVTQAPPLCFPLVMRGRRTRILNPSSSLRASLKHLPSPTTACLFRIILVSESSTALRILSKAGTRNEATRTKRNKKNANYQVKRIKKKMLMLRNKYR